MPKNQFEKIHEEIEGQTQSRQPGIEAEMEPTPIYDDPRYKGSDKLRGKVAIVTGGDSGIGRAVAIAFAKEGADVAIVYLDEHEDANLTVSEIEKFGVKAMKVPMDISKPENGKRIVEEVVGRFGKLNIIVNNAGKQYPQEDFLKITPEQMKETFETNIYSMFYITQAALPYLKDGDSIVNTSSVTAFRGSAHLVDYSATKGAITAFTRSLSQQLIKKGIRVNAVAPGPIWTPLIPATFGAEEVEQHGEDTPIGRRGQPAELAPAYVFLSSEDSSYMTGQTLHVDGGDFIGS
ncbi:SDR family oxidoreductase [Chungangia koreensis]|uniref:SDR family oxidoreductase n=1 Tax=Chungangia koreensis TaxID=752657 RepID=A0ABV8X5H6_9LACT